MTVFSPFPFFLYVFLRETSVASVLIPRDSAISRFRKLNP